jgi:S-ribosylhomocysteine lyase LuxS involved in autoinducer biosynthesis
MERRYERQARPFLCAQKALHTLAHLVGGFVRKRHREDVPASYVFFGD